MTPRVLFVDDEPQVLEGIKRTAGRRIEAEYAVGPAEGLQKLDAAGPFGLVISDMRMPGMSGAQFLTEVRKRSPQTVRMILSGQSDMNATIAAVNQSQIFRFLTKPCTPEELGAAIAAGLEQYALITAERELLEQTLSGAVQVLSEVLALVNPDAYGRGSRIARFVTAMTETSDHSDRWQIRLAGMLSEIGCVALPQDIVAKERAGQQLDEHEKELYDNHRCTAGKLISNIPRLSGVAAIISGVDHEATSPEAADTATTDVVAVGIKILRAAIEMDALLCQGLRAEAAAQQVQRLAPGLPPGSFDALTRTAGADKQVVTRALALKDLAVGMILDEDVMTVKGLRLMQHGNEVTASVIMRLRSFAEGVRIVEPIRVKIVSRT